MYLTRRRGGWALGRPCTRRFSYLPSSRAARKFEVRRESGGHKPLSAASIFLSVLGRGTATFFSFSFLWVVPIGVCMKVPPDHEEGGRRRTFQSAPPACALPAMSKPFSPSPWPEGSCRKGAQCRAPLGADTKHFLALPMRGRRQKKGSSFDFITRGEEAACRREHGGVSLSV